MRLLSGSTVYIRMPSCHSCLWSSDAMNSVSNRTNSKSIRFGLEAHRPNSSKYSILWYLFFQKSYPLKWDELIECEWRWFDNIENSLSMAIVIIILFKMISKAKCLASFYRHMLPLFWHEGIFLHKRWSVRSVFFEKQCVNSSNIFHRNLIESSILTILTKYEFNPATFCADT